LNFVRDWPVGRCTIDRVLKPEEIERFRRRLEADREALASRIAERRGEITETVGEEEGTGDRGDESALIYQREQAIEDVDRERDAVTQIDKALQRIADGTYGISEVSGKPIPIDRLEAVPSATTLVEEPQPEDG
jgi:RNA polymerase-binding protein DksA